MKHKAIHDPFHDPAPQVSNVYKGEEPDELSPFDHSKGGQNRKPLEITDPHHRARFVPTQEPEHTFFKRGK